MARLVFVVALAAAAVGSGCGGSGTPTVEELGQSVVLARDRVDFALQRITQATSREELLERMDEAAAAVEGAAGDLDDAGAPERLQTDVNTLVDSLRQLAFDVRATAEQIRQPGFSELLAGTKGLSFESWDAVNRALAALDAHGIEVAPLERH